MMKRKVVLGIIAVMMTFSLAACSGDGKGSDNIGGLEETEVVEQGSIEQESVEQESVEQDTVSILNDVWAAYGEDEKFYAMGGDATNPVDNAPGLYSLEDADALNAMLLVSADAKGMIDEAASLIHGMNTNNFTGAAFHLTDSANAEDFAASMKDSIKNNQWMCGSPDQYVIYSLSDEYVVTAFGNMDIMKTFKEKFSSVHGENAKVLVEENVAW